MKVIAIAAVSKNGVIGRDQGLPWSIPEDMRFFRESTRGQIVLMGRKTYESLGKALPKRENAVITRSPSWSAPDVKVFHDLGDAVSYYRRHSGFSDRTLFIIGGAEIYGLSTPFLDELWLTEIDSEFEGDTQFPGYRDGRLEHLEFVRSESRAQAESHPDGIRYWFSTYRRVPR
jgi:dihydrofolate reductase